MSEPSPNRLEIVDPHVHLWDLRTRLYPQLETPSIGFTGSNAAIAREHERAGLFRDNSRRVYRL